MRQKILNFTARLYTLILREPPSEKVLGFINNFSWISLGTFGSTLVTAAFTLILIRLLGPFEYGKANLVIRISAFMILPVLWNLHNAVARYLPHSRSDEEKKSIISTSSSVLFVSLIVFSGLFLLIKNPAAGLLRVDVPVWLYSIGYTAVVSFYLFFSGVLRGIGDFKRQSLIYFFSSFVLIVFALYFIIFYDKLTFQAFTVPLIFRWLFVALIFYFFMRRFLSFSFNFKIAKEIFSFSFYTMLGSTAVVLMQGIDSLMLNFFYSPAVVGVFGAYLLASTIVSGKLIDTVVSVALPTVSALENPKPLFEKLTRLWLKIILPIFVISIFTTLIGLLFYGREYPFSWSLVVLFSLQSLAYSIASIHFWLITSRGKEAAKFSARHLIIAALINVGLNYIFIPRWEIFGAVLATILASIYLILISTRFFNKL